MKFSFVSNLKEKLLAHKLVSALVGVVLLCALAYGGYLGFKEYQYRQSAAYALSQIKAALNPPDPAKLSTYVNFQSVTADLAKAIQKNFPFYKAGADQERNIMHNLQAVFLKKISAKEDKKTPLPTDEAELLKKDLQLLPDNFIEQLINSCRVRQEGESTAYLTAKLENPYLKQTFSLVFDMSKTAQGWQVTHLANAQEFMDHLRDSMLARHARFRQLFADKNKLTRKTMNQILPVQSCTVDAGLLSDRKTLLMVVHVIARNRGNVQINNFNLDTTILGRNGVAVMQRYLNAAKPVSPGEDFNHRWNFELDASSPEAQKLLHSLPLRCQGEWQTLSLHSGQVLHIVEEPFEDKQCVIAGHNHPEGFCLTPVFLD